MAGRFTIEAVFKTIDRFSRPIARMQTRLGKFAKSAERGLRGANKMASGFLTGLKKVGVAAGVAGAALAGIAANVIKTGSSFEQAITNVGAVGLQTRDQIQDLEKLALDLGSTTKFTATEAANAMEIMAKAGFNSSEIMAGVPGVLNAAAASGLEIAEVADHVSNALKGMGLEASEASRVSDVLALASSKTNSTIGSLGESIRNVASTARQLGIPFEDMTASVALLQDVGLDASVAGSALNTMLTKMAKPPAAVAAQMKEFGVSFKDAQGNMLPFQEVIANVAKASDKAGGSFDKVAFLADLVGLRGQKAAANLGELFKSGKLGTLTKELQNAEGAAKKMADLKMDTLRGDFTLLESAIDGVKTALFNTEGGPLRDIVKGMTEWVSANKDVIISGVVDFLKTLVTVLQRLGPMVLIFTAWAVAVKIAAAATAIFNAVVAANPITLIAIAVAVAIGLIIGFWPEISAFFVSIWEGIKNIAGSVADFVMGIVNSVKGPIQGFLSGVADFVVGWVKLMFLPLWPAIFLVKLAFGAISQFIRDNWGPITEFFSTLWEGIKTAFSVVWDAIQLVVDGYVALFRAAWEPITEFFSTLWEGVKVVFDTIFGPIIDSIKFAVEQVSKLGKGSFFGLGGFFGGDDEAPGGGSQVVTPQERVARTINETTSTSRGEVVIRDQTGRAQISSKPKGPGLGLSLQSSGGL